MQTGEHGARSARIIHLALNDFKYPSRTIRAISAANEAFPNAAVLVLAVAHGSTPGDEVISGARIRRIAIRSRGLPRSLPFQIVKFAEWAVRVLGNLVRERPLIIQAHSLSTLPIGAIGKWLTGARLLYDAHELETEREEITGFRRRLSKIMEASLIGFADETIVVSPSIQKWYLARYPSSATSLVRNIPPRPAVDRSASYDLRRIVGAHKDDIVFIYLGAVARGRCIPLLLKVFAEMTADKKLVLMGYGDQTTLVRAASERHKNILLIPPVPPEEVLGVVREADVSISLIDAEPLSYRYALPNKLFESLLSYVPPIVNQNCVDMVKIIGEVGAGWCIEPTFPALASLVCELDRSTIQEHKRRLRGSAKMPSWESESHNLVRVYSSLFGRCVVENSAVG